ncbi:MAG: glycosyltransferase [bacterium]|nr:glycosyltransferase [bacterium]
MKKIFIFHASYGLGHKRAAEALCDHMKKHYPDSDIRIFDSMDYVFPLYKIVTKGVYYWSVDKAKWLWKLIFAGVDKAKPGGFYYKWQLYTDLLFARKLIKLVEKENPRCVIFTHFHSEEIVSYIKRLGKIDSKLACVVTDYMAHSIWFQQEIDMFFVASDFVKEGLIRLGCPPGKIFVTGISIGSQFCSDPDVSMLKPYIKRNNILFIGDYIESKKFKTDLRKYKKTYPDTGVFILSKKIGIYLKTELEFAEKESIFCDNLRTDVEKFYKAADIVVSKSGGLTTSELTAMGKALIVFSPIPGQEEANCDALEKADACVRIDDINFLVRKSFEIANSAETVRKLSVNAGKIGKPGAVFEISGKIMDGI